MSIRNVVCAILLLFVASPVEAYPYTGWQKGPWEKLATADGVTVYRNVETGGGIHAYRADVVIDAPADDVMDAVLDHDRARSRSFVIKYDVLHDDGEKTRVYQQIRRAGLGTREATTAGRIFAPTDVTQPRGFHFELVEDGPDDPDVDSFRAMEGSFVLTPLGDTKTRLSHRIYVDPGTWIPDFVLRRALRNGAAEVVDLLRSDVKARQ